MMTFFVTFACKCSFLVIVTIDQFSCLFNVCFFSVCASTHSAAPASGTGKQMEWWETALSLLPQTQLSVRMISTMHTMRDGTTSVWSKPIFIYEILSYVEQETWQCHGTRFSRDKCFMIYLKTSSSRKLAQWVYWRVNDRVPGVYRVVLNRVSFLVIITHECTVRVCYYHQKAAQDSKLHGKHLEWGC